MSDERFAVIAAGFAGDAAAARAGLESGDPKVRASALRALARCGEVTSVDLNGATSDAEADVRRTAAELAAAFPAVELVHLFDDDDVFVAEMAVWATGERDAATDDEMAALIAAATGHEEPLVREAAAAALGALGDPRGLDAIISACSDKPAIRRRAVLALAPFDDPRVDEVLRAALEDRDWQVRQNAEDLLKPRS